MEKKLANLLVLLGKTRNEIPSYWCGRQVLDVAVYMSQ